jgi:TolA-binding protein
MIPGLKLIDDILAGLPENARLRAQLTELRGQVDTLQRELEAARAEIQRLRQQQQSQDRLPQESEQMLVLIANKDGRITSDMVIRHLGLPKARGDYFFDKLTKHKLVDTAGGQMGVGWFYFATQAGREYMAEHGLL